MVFRDFDGNLFQDGCFILKIYISDGFLLSMVSEEQVVIIGKDIIVDKKSKAADRENELIEVLKIFAPGTAIRIALDDIMRARMGALIVVNSEKISSIIEGGFRVNCKFSPQRLVELCKMDGAIVLSDNLKKILYANTLLSPSIGIPTKETGTRHKAAERTAKQFKTIVVAVSERRNRITLYFGEFKYVLEETSEILRRAAETLQILEKQKDIFNDLLYPLNLLEMNNLVTTSDVAKILREMETIRRIAESVRRYLVELGKEGIIVSMRLQELTRNLNKEREMILVDYFKGDSSRVDETLKSMNFDILLETSNILKTFFHETRDKSISPQGIRILSKTGIEEENIKILLNKYKTLDNVFSLDREALMEMFKDERFARTLKQNLDSLKEKILVGKSI